MTPRGASPFSPRTVLGLLLFGAAAFLAALYFIGTGQTGGRDNNGGSHAASNGLTGYSALAELLEAQGYTVSLSRQPSRLRESALMILTPTTFAEADAIQEVIEDRRYVGPTLVILPKWLAAPIPDNLGIDVEDGWVMLGSPVSPVWGEDFLGEGQIDIEVDHRGKEQGRWQGFGLAGKLPEPGTVQSISSGRAIPLVRNGSGQDLVSFWDDGGYHPELSELAGFPQEDDSDADVDAWPIVIVAEPDLVNNYGMADRERALLALGIVSASMEGADLPVTFDLTMAGLGNAANLLTLAFSPPFLAATLCLIAAAIVIGWRAFRRFGPPIAEAPVFAFGKRQLATNGAALIQRSRRLHLLGAPYAAIMRTRIAHLLGLKPGENAAHTEQEIDRLLERRGLASGDFAENADALRHARSAHELLRRADALKKIERKLTP